MYRKQKTVTQNKISVTTLLQQILNTSRVDWRKAKIKLRE